MELLVVTLVYTIGGRDADILARIRLIADTVRNAQGLVASRFYRGKGSRPCYVIFTTWEDTESWQRAQERYSPKQLLQGSVAELLNGQPEQWFMHYLWGYSRPAANPSMAAVHFATIRTELADMAQRGWLEGLRRQAVQPTLSFAFLARGTHEMTTNSKVPATPFLLEQVTPSSLQDCVFLNLLSWANEDDRDEYYADANYQAVNQFVNSIGAVEVLVLEPM